MAEREREIRGREREGDSEREGDMERQSKLATDRKEPKNFAQNIENKRSSRCANRAWSRGVTAAAAAAVPPAGN